MANHWDFVLETVVQKSTARRTNAVIAAVILLTVVILMTMQTGTCRRHRIPGDNPIKTPAPPRQMTNDKGSFNNPVAMKWIVA